MAFGENSLAGKPKLTELVLSRDLNYAQPQRLLHIHICRSLLIILDNDMHQVCAVLFFTYSSHLVFIHSQASDNTSWL